MKYEIIDWEFNKIPNVLIDYFMIAYNEIIFLKYVFLII